MTFDVVLQFGIPGGMELVVILLIAILLFGASRIPKLARSTGQALGEFQRGREEVEQELQEMQSESSDATRSAERAPPETEQPTGNDEDRTPEADEVAQVDDEDRT